VESAGGAGVRVGGSGEDTVRRRAAWTTLVEWRGQEQFTWIRPGRDYGEETGAASTLGDRLHQGQLGRRREDSLETFQVRQENDNSK